MRYRTGMNLPYDVKWYLILDNLIDRKRSVIFEIYLIDRNTIYLNIFKYSAYFIFYFLTQSNILIIPLARKLKIY